MTLSTRSVRVLALDDDPDDLAILRHHLRGIHGLDVKLSAFSEVGDAVAELQNQAFDVVLLDYQLGARTGIDVFHELQLMAYDSPVILMTDQGNEELAVLSLHSGMADYMPKSAIGSKSLRRAIVNAIEKHELRKSLVRYRKDLEGAVDDLRRRNEEIQSFYHTLSHELKTPLTAAREFVAIVLDGLQGELNGDQAKSLRTAKSCCDQMVLLMNDILDATRLETGKLSLQAKPTSLGKVVEQAVSQCNSAATDGEISVVFDVEDGLEAAHIDPQRILQVITNLLNNALKYSPRGGQVSVSCRAKAGDPDVQEVLVQDWGRGIPSDRVDRIFDRLYQASEDDATVRGGLGLGLNLCRELVRLHGGDIVVESTFGEGSTFTFTVPAASKANTRETCS
jgi:signal transduction histidine kinase